ncbi:unnamed protein product [Dovyalis caffra]|uniref:Uncharacterized protein n=1 Tax=Dovyalis caffra TaxID=77055 RepID=A0AAV1R2G6_9ROSI|nr:unnamed protein product [Dovyalis caffra]
MGDSGEVTARRGRVQSQLVAQSKGKTVVVYNKDGERVHKSTVVMDLKGRKIAYDSGCILLGQLLRGRRKLSVGSFSSKMTVRKNIAVANSVQQRKWRDMFHSHIGEGELEFVEPTMQDGESVASITRQTAVEGLSNWTYCLVGSFFGKNLKLSTSTAGVNNLWGGDGNIVIIHDSFSNIVEAPSLVENSMDLGHNSFGVLALSEDLNADSDKDATTEMIHGRWTRQAFANVSIITDLLKPKARKVNAKKKGKGKVSIKSRMGGGV